MRDVERYDPLEDWNPGSPRSQNSQFKRLFSKAKAAKAEADNISVACRYFRVTSHPDRNVVEAHHPTKPPCVHCIIMYIYIYRHIYANIVLYCSIIIHDVIHVYQIMYVRDTYLNMIEYVSIYNA